MSFNMQDILRKFQEMQADVKRVQEELANKTLTAEAGGGMVKATVNGRHEVVKLDIDPACIVASEKEVLEDIVIAAVNKAMREISEQAAAEMQKITPQMPNIPGLNFPG